MAKLTTLACLCAVCLLSGCTILRVCPPVKGTVVDAITGAPIKSATVTIGYFNSEQVSQTDSRGRFSFEAKHRFVVLLPAPIDPVSGFSLQAKVDGYSTSDTMRYGPWMGLEPPPKITESPTGTPKMVYTGEVIVVDPIALVPASVKDSAQR